MIPGLETLNQEIRWNMVVIMVTSLVTAISVYHRMSQWIAFLAVYWHWTPLCHFFLTGIREIEKNHSKKCRQINSVPLKNDSKYSAFVLKQTFKLKLTLDVKLSKITCRVEWGLWLGYCEYHNNAISQSLEHRSLHDSRLWSKSRFFVS